MGQAYHSVLEWPYPLVQPRPRRRETARTAVLSNTFDLRAEVNVGKV